MELKWLKSFQAVAADLHFRRAAAGLGITQPALSQHVAKLEAELGVQLLERDRRTVRLTAAGESLRDETVAPLAKLDEALTSARLVGGLREKTLKVGQLQFVSHAFLPPAIQSLRRARPDVVVNLLETPPHEIVQAVRDGTIDVGLGLEPFSNVDDLVVREVLRGRLVAWLPRAHPLAALKEVPLDRIAEEPLILFSRAINPRAHDLILRTLGPSARIAHELQQPQHGPPMVLQGLGCFVVADYVIRERHRGVVSRPISGFQPLRISAVWRPDGRMGLLKPFLAGLPRLRARR